jgi:hypothetical protein
MITWLDNQILQLFTRFSHWFQRLTGKTNYWIMKHLFFFIFLYSSLMVANCWFPIFQERTSPLNLFANLTVLHRVYMLVDECNVAEDKSFGTELVKLDILNSEFDVFFRKLMTLIMVSCLLRDSAMSLYYILLGKLFLPSNLEELSIDLFLYSIWAIHYLAVVTPLPPGISKIQEWKESFNAGFKKRIPLPITLTGN